LWIPPQGLRKDNPKGISGGKMADESISEGTQDTASVSEEKFREYQAFRDKQYNDLSAELNKAREEERDAKATVAVFKEGADDDTKARVDREFNLKLREAKVVEGERGFVNREKTLMARELVTEAKANYGVEIDLQELLKLGDRGEMAIAVMNKVMSESKGKPAGDKPKLPLGGSTPVKSESRYQQDDFTTGLGDFLRGEGRAP